MGKAREQEVRLMGFAFVALALLAALALILGATKIGSEVHSRRPEAVGVACLPDRRVGSARHAVFAERPRPGPTTGNAP